MSQEVTPALKPYDTLYFICRAQPFTIGHKHNIDQAMQLAKRVVVIIGSAYRARDTRNPFTYSERVQFISTVYPDEVTNGTIEFAAQRDYPYQDTMWVSYIQKLVQAKQEGRDGKIGIIGHMKDDTYYLSLFPQWDFVPVDSLGNDAELNATAVRKAYFEDAPKLVEHMIPAAVRTMMFDFKYHSSPDVFRTLSDEHFHLKKYRAAWEKAPYAPTFVTCDALIVQSGHVLLIKRKSAPGKGLWAIPGGFLNQGERIIDGIFRELMEETKIKVPLKVLRGSLVGQHVYDHPQRSLRGRVITHAGIVYLEDGPLPKVKGSDDAVKAIWVPISEVYKMQNQFFEDHFFIIEDLLNRFPTRS